jgi:hypothetical protein
MRGELTVLDGSREALAAVDASVRGRPRELKVRLVQDDVAGLCLGRSRIRFQFQHVIVLDGLVEYLPERVAASMLGWATRQLVGGGALVVTGLGPAPDDAVVRHLLDWPLVRRGRAAFGGLLASAGLEDPRVYEAGSAGLAATARAPAREAAARPALLAQR